MESYSIEAILSATDSGFTGAMKDAEKSIDSLNSKYEGAFQDKAGRWRTADGKFMTMKEKSEMLGNSFDETKQKSKKMNTSILDIAKGVGVFKLVESAVSLVSNSVDGAIDRFDTLNKYPVVMEALGYSTEEVEGSMTKLKDGIDGLPTRLDDIVANTQQLAISTGSLDKGTDTAIALNNAFLASGASTADASRGMEQYRQMLGRGEVDMQSFKSVQETMPIAMDKVAKSFEDRGVKSTNELYDALKDGNITFTEFNDRLIELNDGIGGFADLAEKNSKGIKTSMENLKGSVVKGLETTIRAIDEGLAQAGLGGITDILDNLKDGINETFSVINKVVPPAIGLFISLYNKMKPILPFFGILIGYTVTYQTVMGTAKKATQLWAGAQKLLNAVMAANPIGLIIAAVIILVGTIIYLWKTNEDFRNAVIKIWESVKEAFINAVETIKDAWKATKDFFVTTWSGVSDWFSELWDDMKEMPKKATEYIKKVWTDVKKWFSDLWDGIKEAFSAGWDNIVSMFSPYVQTFMDIFEPVTNFFKDLWENVKTITAAAWELIKSVIAAPLLFIVGLVTGDLTQMKDDMQMIWETIKNSVSEIWNAIKDIILGYVRMIVDTSSNIWEAFKTFVSNLWNSVKNNAVKTWESLKNETIRIFNNTVDGTKNLWSDFKEWIINLVTNLKNSVVDGWESLKSNTVNIFNSLVSSAKEVWQDLKNSVSDTVDRVKSIFDTLREINLWEAGKAIMDSFLEGLKKAWGKVQEFVGGIGDWIRKNKGPIEYDRRLLIPAGEAIMAGLNRGLDDGFGDVQNTVGDMTKFFADTAFKQDFEIGANFSELDNKLRSVNDMDISRKNELTLKEAKTPAEIKLNMGNRVYRAFIDDIDNAIGQNTDLLLEH